MALSAFESQFADALVKAETPGSQTAAEAAQKFADAYINFFAKAQVNFTSANMAILQSPAAVSALVGGLTSAFEATGGPSAVCDLMEAAFFAYWNAGPIQAMFTTTPTIASIAPGGPLSSNMSSISSPDPSQNSAKAKVAAAISLWMTTQPTIAMTPPPPGVTTKFT
jgi:hypothetical protein